MTLSSHPSYLPVLLVLLDVAPLAGCSADDPDATTAASTTADADTGDTPTTGDATGDASSGETGDPPAAVCPRTHDGVTSDGHPVVVCDELYADAPHVRPPADSGSTVIAATDGGLLYVRGEEARPLATDERVVMSLEDLEVRRYGYALYSVTRDGQGKVTASVPAILVSDEAFFGLLAGKTAEGLISRHKTDVDNPDLEYELEPTLPLRIRFTETTPGAENPELLPVVPATLGVVLENADAPALASTGECLAAVTAAGVENPFVATDLSTFVAMREPSMHGPGDNEFVLGGANPLSHMTPGWIVMPHHLLADGPAIAFPEAEFTPHGNPLSMPRMRFTVVEGGGGDCTP